MVLNILVLIKTILYIGITEIQFNKFLVFLITFLISSTILELISRSNIKNKQKARLIFYNIISIIMFVDVVYYIQFSTLPSIALLSQVSQLSAVGDSIKYLLGFKNLLLILDLPILIIIYLVKRRQIEEGKINQETIRFQSEIDRQEKWELARRIIFKTSVTLLVILGISVGILGEYDSVRSQELYTYHITDIIDTLISSASKEILTKADISELEKRTNLKPGKHTGLGQGKNLIVVQVEALQNFVIGLEYNGQEITPELNKLIGDKSSLYYDKYYQLVGRGNTSDAEFVSHNSLHPSMEEPSYTRYEKNDFYGLPALLKDEGYKTIAMHGHDGDYWNREKAYKGQGFDKFLSKKDYKFEKSIGLGIRDEDFFKQNVAYLKDYKEKNDSPFYSFMVTLTSHTPFNIPKEYREIKLNKEHENNILGNYLNSIHYTDKQIGLLIDELKKAGLYEDTVIAIYGDHYAISTGHEDDQKLMTKFLGREYDFDEMMNIPLLIHVPGQEIKETISKTGSQLDFYPTILNIMGYENKKGLIFGRDITNYVGYNFVAPQTYMRKGSFIDDEITFVISRDAIFDHSRAYNIGDSKEVKEISDYKWVHEMAINEINKSDFILKNNILGDYMKNGGSIDFTKIENKDKQIIEIKNLRRNSLEELNRVYNDGARIIGLDLSQTKDGQIVLLKNWDKDFKENFKTDKDRVNLEEFNKLTLKNGESPLDLKGLAKWMDSHMDVQLVLRADKNEEKVLVAAFDLIGLEDEIVEIKDFQSYLELTNNRYNQVILNPQAKRYDIKEIIEFISRYPNLGILANDVDEDKLNELNKRTVDIYVDID